MKTLNRIVLALGYLVIVLALADVVIGNLRNFWPKVDPSDSGIWAQEVLAEQHSARWMGDGHSMVVWTLRASQEDVLFVVSPDHVERNRIWFPGPLDERGLRALEFLSEAEGYEAVRPHVEEMLAAPRFFYAFDRFKAHGDLVQNCLLWIVSPDTGTLAHLNVDF